MYKLNVKCENQLRMTYSGMPCSPLQSHMEKMTKPNQAICAATICFLVYRAVPSMSVYRSSW